MKKKIDYRNRSAQFTRQNGIKAWFYDFAWNMAGFARVPIELHTRKKMGIRYFSFSSSLFFLFMFGWFPVVVKFFTTNPFQYPYSESPSFWSILYHNALLYAYLVYTGYVAWKHQQEKNARPSVYDFTHYTKSTGLIDPRILNLKFGSRFATIREIETFWEPLMFFLPGVLLLLIGQTLGAFLIVCSILYSLSYRAAYKKGDDQMLDIIDDMIEKEELIATIVGGRSKAQARGYQFYGNTPNDPEMRRKAAYAMAEDIPYEEVK